jgi:RimJ/RimL family protein N-acetyltransferase
MDDMRGWVQNLLMYAQAGTDLPFAVVHKASGEVAGATRYLNMQPEHRGLEIGGTWYGLQFQRTVVNTESKYLLLTYAFERLGCIRVQFKTDLRNARSQKAIERLGAIREGVLRNHMVMPDGRYRDSVYYSILESEWPVVKQRLEGFMEQPKG